MASLTAFDPTVQGFKFPNRFSFRQPHNLPIRDPDDLSQFTYGLCGGMSFAALDYYYAQRAIPPQSNIPQIGDALYGYLLRRQIDSLSPPFGLLRVVEWMALPDRMVGARTATREFPKLTRSIDHGKPVVLTLIRQTVYENPTLNHQVVVWGYELSANGRNGLLHVYDPNKPLARTHITVDFSDPAQGVQIIEATSEPVRGFYLSEYLRDRGVP